MRAEKLYHTSKNHAILHRVVWTKKGEPFEAHLKKSVYLSFCDLKIQFTNKCERFLNKID